MSDLRNTLFFSIPNDQSQNDDNANDTNNVSSSDIKSEPTDPDQSSHIEMTSFGENTSSLETSGQPRKGNGDDLEAVPRDLPKDEKPHEQKNKQSNKSTLLYTILCLCAFSVLGEALRVFLANLFGGECRHEDTPWLYTVVTGANVCVTSNGATGLPGGALFLDLPANMLGSFVMGMLQPTRDLGLLNDMPIAFLNQRHWYQSWKIAHIGLRTGFCGSLTTFASWNTQMVVMIMGAGGGGSQFFSAAFGYVIGLELAMASLGIGRATAIWLHRYVNPHLAAEEEIAGIAYSKGRELPSKVNRGLPDHERRYLASLASEEELLWAKENLTALDDFESWRISTEKDRNGEGEDAMITLLSLQEIERNILIDKKEIGPKTKENSEKMGWDVMALQNFSTETNGFSDFTKPNTSSSNFLQYVVLSAPFVMAFGVLLGFGLVAFIRVGDEADVYRGFFLNALFAPPGCLIRWKLSVLNGKLKGKWAWFPLGTFLANMGASIISALMKGISISLDSGGWSIAVVGAIKTGFAGSMSTVSTFVVEGWTLRRKYRHHAKGYHYTIGSLMLACVLGLTVYGPIVASS